MKKWWIFGLAAMVACGGIAVFVGNTPQAVTVEAVRLTPQTVEETVTCQGVMEPGDTVMVSLPTSCILRDVVVEEGQSVEAGDLLLRVDKEASRMAGLASGADGVLALTAMEAERRAPRSGVVVSVKAHAGDAVEKDKPCVLIAPRDALQVRVYIREKELPRLKEGMAVRVSGDGLRRGRYTGTLTEISSAATVTESGGTVVEGVVELDADQLDDSMRLGLTAKAQVVVSSMEETFVIPYAALQQDEAGREFVYILKNGVPTRYAVPDGREITDGLAVMDESLRDALVVTQPELVVQDGLAVTVREVEA